MSNPEPERFYVEREDHEDGSVGYVVWQVRPDVGLPQGEREIATFHERDYPDAKVLAERVAAGLNITTDMK